MTIGRPPRALREDGFTLIELLVVIVIIGILLSVAVSSYLNLRARAERVTAAGNVRAIVPSIEGYGNKNGTFVGMTLAALKADYDQSLDPSDYSFGSSGNLTATSYCVESTLGGETWSKAGPAEPISPGACPAGSSSVTVPGPGGGATAAGNVGTIVPSIEAYGDDNGTFVGMTLAGLKADYDQSLDPDDYSFGSSGNLTATSYCVESTIGGETWSKAGPGRPIRLGACP